MIDFKFFREIILTTYDGHDISFGETFYSLNKEDHYITTRLGIRKKIPKHTIVERSINKKLRSIFKPDHDALLYFKHKSNADRYVFDNTDFDEMLIELPSTIR